ncbi:uncharacterized protein BYT42DRAFT_252038 [Radiomyces spectabilis]|uniref:uncharacterized protein n=1 Tax=Radiomyces spectabilis TaxID=64574 RepID=UPI00221F9BDD|nr:uncharacterized protein BYT42DRAFT_252038 [Radiomyces spectabilis]KAI8388919.1 hypothetical protein BYT42DRAFT_252038 [Radiomyces spectabilis]
MASNIYEAAATGDIAYLKQHSSKLREKNERGWTVLHFAARYGQLETTQYLCQQPIDHNALNGEGKSAYQLAQFWGNEKVAEVLRSYEPSTEKPSKKSTVMNQPLNHFAGNPLNRCSWYRDDPAVLMKLARSPQAKYIILQKQNMLYNESTSKLYYATYSEVAPIVDELYGDTEQSAQQQVILVFLGIDEAEDKEAAYWALDVTPKGIHTDKYHAIINDLTSKLGVKFENPRPKAFTLDKQTAGILAQALSMVDWNARNTFCPACGQETISEEGGHKRYCPPRSENDTKHERCISTKGVSNFSYPRTGTASLCLWCWML